MALEHGTPAAGTRERTRGDPPTPVGAGGPLFAPAADPRVRRSVLTMYVGAGLLFLVNNVLGFLNVMDAPDLPRWQALTHLHAGTIGWITLGVIATAVWLFVGQRRVSDGVAAYLTGLAWLAVVGFGGYVLAFALAFSQGDPFFALLPVFGTGAAVVVVMAFLFTASQFRHQPVVTTPHLMLGGGLLVATMGAVFGVLLGLRDAGGPDVLGAGWFAHPLSMDIYIILAMAGIVEAHVARDARPYRWHGLLQAALMVVAVFLAAAGVLADTEALLGIAFPLFLAGVLVYLLRVAWRGFRVNPFQGGHHANLFWGALGLLLFIVIFIVIPEEDEPRWMLIAFVHFLGVGAATNLLLATQSRAAARPGGWLEPTAAWTLNLGLLAFILGAYAAERSDGAAVMGIGVVVAVVAMIVRLLRTPADESPPPGAGVPS